MSQMLSCSFGSEGVFKQDINGSGTVMYEPFLSSVGFHCLGFNEGMLCKSQREVRPWLAVGHDLKFPLILSPYLHGDKLYLLVHIIFQFTCKHCLQALSFIQDKVLKHSS